MSGDSIGEAVSTSSGPEHEVWGQLFGTGATELLMEINASVRFDHRLAQDDIAGSVAHVRMLEATGILSSGDADQIVAGLHMVRTELESGVLPLDPRLEDIHMNIEDRLRKLIGPVAGRLHTGRSRNDQVAVDAKLWVRRAEERLDRRLADLIDTLIARALEFADAAMPGFTHLQAAQPVTLGHHLLAYAEMLLRDRDRIRTAHARADESPLGAAALAGTTFPIDSDLTARDLGFRGPMRNSLDAVSDRDFIVDFLAMGSMLSIHLSRLGEELVLWTTPQFGYVRLSDELGAGSSIMPQKRNPDIAELIRAKSGRVVGNLVSLLIVLKGLPLAYSRDLQEDKEALFDTADTLDLSVRCVEALVSGLTVDRERMKSDALRGNTLATDVADWLVAQRGVPFREAHLVVADLVRDLATQNLELHEADIETLRAASALLSDIPAEVLTVEHSIASRNSRGGTAPARVRQAAEQLRSINHELESLCGDPSSSLNGIGDTTS